MNNLESRKQLLIAESELNRAQMVEDMRTLKGGVRTFTHRTPYLGPVASSAGALAMGLAGAAFQRGRTHANTKPSRSDTIIGGAVLIATLWLAFRAQSRRPSDL